MPVSEARPTFAALIKQIHSRRSHVIVEKGGILVIALVALSDLERWTRLDQEREERFNGRAVMRARNADTTAEEVERDVADEVPALRREKRACQAT